MNIRRKFKIQRERCSIKESLDVYENSVKFKEEKEKIYYKAFRVGDLFERDNRFAYKNALKDVDYQEYKNEEYCIPFITLSGFNNGISGFLKKSDKLKNYIINGYMTIASDCAYAGTCFYHNYDFIILGNGSLANTLTVRDSNIKKSLDNNKDAYYYISKLISILFQNKLHGWNRKIGTGNDFDHEIILLPVYDKTNEISTSKMEELYHKSVIKSKQDAISERESNYSNQEGTSQLSSNSIISVDVMGYLYILSKIQQFNKKAKQLQDEIINF